MSNTMDTKLSSSESAHKVHLGTVHSKNETSVEDEQRTEDSPDVTPYKENDQKQACDDCNCNDECEEKECKDCDTLVTTVTTSVDWTDWVKLDEWQSWASTTWEEHHQTILTVGSVTVGVGLAGWVTWANRSRISSWVTNMTKSSTPNTIKTHKIPFKHR